MVFSTFPENLVVFECHTAVLLTMETDEACTKLKKFALQIAADVAAPKNYDIPFITALRNLPDGAPPRLIVRGID